MEDCLRQQVSCCLIMMIIRQRKKDIGEIEKIKEYKNAVKRKLRLCITLYVCVCLIYPEDNLKFVMQHMYL